MIALIYFWLLLVVIGYVLIFFRKDSSIVLEEIQEFLIRPFPLWIISTITLLLILPTTIPYSIIYIFKSDDSERDN